MLRFIHRKLIIPRGDTGSFYLPVRQAVEDGDVAVFAVLDTVTGETVLTKVIDASTDFLFIMFDQEDTINLPAGKYYWDIKIYHCPEYDEDGKVINGLTVDSYYSAYQLPQLVIKEATLYGN